MMDNNLNKNGETPPATVSDGSNICSFVPEYGAQCPITKKYYSQRAAGQPQIVGLERLSSCKFVDETATSKTGSDCTQGFGLLYTYSSTIRYLWGWSGLGMSRSSWINQVEFFSAKPDYSCLVIENRGFDDFEAMIPLQIANIKRMARDMCAALDALKWNKPKSLHIVGFSMGGMIAMQLCRIWPENIASLHLISTAARYKAPKLKAMNAVTSIQLLKKHSDTAKAAKMLDLLFTAEYLYAFDDSWPEFKNNRERFLHEGNIHVLLSKNQGMCNFYTQLLACAHHKLSTKKLWEIASKIKYIFVSSADEDSLLHQECAKELMLGLSAQGRLYRGGHMVPWQHAAELNADEEAMIIRAEKEYTEYPPNGDVHSIPMLNF